MNAGRRAGDDGVNTSEFQMVEAMLRQQSDFMGQRFDMLGESAEEIKDRLAKVEEQVRITNGTVKRHTAELAALELPDKLPLLTKAQGRFAQWLIVKTSVGLGAAYALVQWVLTNWGHLVPLLTSKVS